MNLQRIANGFMIAVLVALAIAPAKSDAMSIGISMNFGPPAIPVYVQPPAPAPNLIWQPGYWARGPFGYFWVPGTWVNPPRYGMLWTPGYWGWNNYAYFWHPGYWAQHVGFYGGVNYGYGYYGRGYVGGGWFGNVFRYNTAITNVNTTIIRNVYIDKTVVVNNVYNNVSYNGGPGGIVAQPDRREMLAAREPHIAMTPEQREHVRTAQQNRAFLAKVNNGRPADAVVAQPLSRTNKPASFTAIRPEDRTIPTAANMTRPRASMPARAPVSRIVPHRAAAAPHRSAPHRQVRSTPRPIR